MRVGLGYPEREDEREILRRFRTANPLTQIEAVVTTEQIREANGQCREVYVHSVLEDYILDLVRASREHPNLTLGVSPRGTLAFYRTCQAWAAVQGRSYVIPDDIKRMAAPVLAHRLVPNVESRLQVQGTEQILAKLIQQTPVPVEEVWDAP